MLSRIAPSTYNMNTYNTNLADTNITTAKFNGYAKSEAYYARRGETIYQREMDLDEDGVISFEELHKYCNNHNADFQELLKNWTTYRSGQGIDGKSEVENEEKEDKDYNVVYARKGDRKYDAVMDSDEDGKITYKEYLEYCKQHAKEEQKTSKIEIKDEDGKFEITNSAAAISAYTKTEAPEGKIETEA